MARAVLEPATRSDAKVLHALVGRLAETTGESDLVTSKPHDFVRFGFETDPPAFEAVIAWARDSELGAAQAVGFVLYFVEFSSWRGRPGVYIQDLWVDDARRGEGLGASLLAEAFRRAAGGAATYARLSVAADNAQARGFYLRRGFHAHAHDHLVVDGERFTALRAEPQESTP